MSAVDIIMKKRGESSHFGANTKEEIEYLIEGYVKGEIPDYQMSAYLMAVYFNGMNVEEVSHLTHAMLNSGDRIDLGNIRKKGEVFVDKHSTGGVGDKISLPLAAIVASCGVKVPMMAGRALGYTGGTLDKLEAIEGYRTDLSIDQFKKTIEETGFAIMGQTERIVPADRLLYALRDVTGTVESIPLITSSILSKKVAEGADAFCFDVKAGSGAFMKNIKDAKLLAESVVRVSREMGKKAMALITNMDIPLGKKIGNWLEIEESLDALKGSAPKDVMELTLALASHMLFLAGVSPSYDEGLKIAQDAVSSGRAFEVFCKNVEVQGGNVAKMLEQNGFLRSQYKAEILAEADGFISRLDALTCGIASVKLGVGREKKTDSVCALAGIELFKTYGDKVSRGEPLMMLYGKSEGAVETASKIIKDAIDYSKEQIEQKVLIYEEIM